MKAGRRRRWNHNLHFHRFVLRAVPRDARTALDVGTGDGLLARDLATVVPMVTGLDLDCATLARASAGSDAVEWVCGDVMTYDFAHRFDIVASIATLHHLPLTDALRRLAELTAPGGVLVIVGLARASTPSDHLRELLGVAQHQWYSRTRSFWEHTAPTLWPPPNTYAEVRRQVSISLPGARWQQFPLWRYAITWQRPLGH